MRRDSTTDCKVGAPVSEATCRVVSGRMTRPPSIRSEALDRKQSSDDSVLHTPPMLWPRFRSLTRPDALNSGILISMWLTTLWIKLACYDSKTTRSAVVRKNCAMLHFGCKYPYATTPSTSTKRPTWHNGVENEASRSIFGLVWPWPLILWPQGWPFHAVAPWTTCSNWRQNQFTRFQNIVFTSLVAVERTGKRTHKLRTLCPACQSGLKEA